MHGPTARWNEPVSAGLGASSLTADGYHNTQSVSPMIQTTDALVRRPGAPFTPGERRLLAEFVDRALAALGPAQTECILVFGSRARGEGHPDSDLDLAVCTTRTVPADAHRRLAVLAEEVQADDLDLPHLRPILIRAGERTNQALLHAIQREGIELWAKKNA